MKMEQACFGNVTLVGKNAKQLADTAMRFSETAEGRKIAQEGAEAGRKAKEMLEKSGQRLIQEE